MAVCCFCKFGKVEDDNTITCRRFPVFISKAPDDWCGEFKDAQQSVQLTGAWCPKCNLPPDEFGDCIRCGEPIAPATNA